MTRLYIINAAVCVGLILTGTAAWRLAPERLGAAERFCRNRFFGLVAGWVTLLMCVPHALVVSPAFLQNWLPVLALGLPVLCWFYLDYLAARAAAGLAILGAYEVIHLAFDCRLPGAAALTVGAWAVGIAGIWISGRPCTLRDWLRLGAAHRNWSRAAAGFFWLFAAGIAAATLAAALRPGSGDV